MEFSAVRGGMVWGRTYSEASVVKKLTTDILLQEAAEFAKAESKYDEPSLYGITDGKAIGT